MKYPLFFISVVLVLALIACEKTSTPVPGAKDGEEVWHNLLRNDHGIELVSFKKIDGQLDGNHYILHFEAQVRYLDNNIHDPVAAPGVGIRANRMGTVETIRASYEFQKTEKGWQGQDGHLYEFGH